MMNGQQKMGHINYRYYFLILFLLREKLYFLWNLDAKMSVHWETITPKRLLCFSIFSSFQLLKGLTVWLSPENNKIHTTCKIRVKPFLLLLMLLLQFTLKYRSRTTGFAESAKQLKVSNSTYCMTRNNLCLHISRRYLHLPAPSTHLCCITYKLLMKVMILRLSSSLTSSPCQSNQCP